MDAPGALDSLLGRLTTVLVHEAQLLGGVRSDVEFIKDEMESMNGLILHLTEAQHRDHQVRAWMKQVVGLTRDCEGNVELYVHYVGSRPGDHGLLGFLRRIARFLLTIPVRHRIAMRIRELKVRARDVGDRRQRYGVTMPESTRVDMSAVDIEPSGGEEDLRRRAVLLDGPVEPSADDEEVIRRAIDTLIKCLPTEPATTEDGVPQPHVRVFGILGDQLVNKVAEGLYQQHSSLSTLFDCKAFSNFYYPKVVGEVLAEILEQVGVQLQPDQEEDEVTNLAAGTTVFEDEEKRLISKIHGHLKGKRFLMVVRDHVNPQYYYYYKVRWKRLLDALLQAADGCLPGSALLVTTDNDDVALWSSPYKIINARSLKEFYSKKIDELNVNYDDYIIQKLAHSSNFASRMFLHLLYVKPTISAAERDMCHNAISKGVDHTMVMLCYNELPSKHRSCLWYLSIFPQGHVIRTTSLARRLIAEGLITAPTSSAASYVIQSSTDEAERYLDVLFIRGFVTPREISATGNIKSFVVHPEVQDFIARVARDVNFVDTDQPTSFTHRLSIHNRIGWLKSTADVDSKDIAAYLPSLAASFPQWQLLKVLDLEDCNGLNKKHMKSICKILLLKYLSLRNTDVTELPKQMKDLQCLETLDIRQTKVQMLAKKYIVLPLLKHFLAGHKISDSNCTGTSGESFSAVELPLGIHKMKNMEILSHVKVTNSDSELTRIAQLLKLRKLGVALHGKCTKLSDLFSQIEKLHRCLRALSIWIDPMAAPDNHDAGIEDALPSLPKFIERLNISGISNGISNLFEEQHQLIKITLSETYIKEDDLRLLGKLKGLCCLRLQHYSYSDSELSLKEDEFKSLKYLLVKGSSITRISFVEGAAPELGRIVWSFDRMDGLSGTEHLSKLKEVQLNGDCIYINRH